MTIGRQTSGDRRGSGSRHKRQVPEQAGTGRKERASRQKGTGASRSGAGLDGADWRRKGQTGDHRTANKRDEVRTNQKRGRPSISRPRIKGVEVFSKRQKQVAADLAKTFVDRFLFEEGVCRWHMTDERLKRLPKVMQLIFDDYLFRHIYSEAVYLA